MAHATRQLQGLGQMGCHRNSGQYPWPWPPDSDAARLIKRWCARSSGGVPGSKNVLAISRRSHDVPEIRLRLQEVVRKPCADWPSWDGNLPVTITDWVACHYIQKPGGISYIMNTYLRYWFWWIRINNETESPPQPSPCFHIALNTCDNVLSESPIIENTSPRVNCANFGFSVKRLGKLFIKSTYTWLWYSKCEFILFWGALGT